MNAFLAGEIDAAQAMTYNEYAQVLEKKNPATGELWQPVGPERHLVGVRGHVHAPGRDLHVRVVAGEGRQRRDIAVKFLKASFRGWIFCRDNAAECVDIVLKHDAKLPKGHQTWQLNEVNALIWPSPNGIGIMDQAAFDRTVQISVDSKVLKAPPTGTAFRNDLAQQAITALGSSVDSKGATLAEGQRHR